MSVLYAPKNVEMIKTTQKRRVGGIKVGKVVKFFDYSIFKSWRLN